MPGSPASVPNETFVITRVVAAPRDRVWDAWTKPDLYARWFGPKGCITTVKTADVRPGGLLHSRLDTPDGGTMWARCVYRTVAAPSHLVWVQSFSDEHAAISRAPFFGGRWPREMLTDVTFADEGAGTRITLTWTPLEAEADEKANFVGNIPSRHGGWGGTFDQLDAFLAG
jgi:uncharacterized protein YndB with AHSA1/START domain